MPTGYFSEDKMGECLKKYFSKKVNEYFDLVVPNRMKKIRKLSLKREAQYLALLKEFDSLSQPLKLAHGTAFAYEIGTVTSDFLSASFFDAIPAFEHLNKSRHNIFDQTILDCSSNSVMENTYMPSFIQLANMTMDTPELEDVGIISPFF